MKRQALEQVIYKHIHHIEKPSGQIPGSFAAEDIHELRVEYKKSRAFLRLLQLERDAEKLKMPADLKNTYHAAGQVRDTQLFISLINSLPEAATLPVFNRCLQKELFTSKERLVQAIEHLHFKKIQSAIKKELPQELHSATVQQFVYEKMAAIRILILAAEKDKHLHSIRKHLKDLLYNKKLLGNDLETLFPIPDVMSEQVMDEMATKLGDFNDHCTALTMLQFYEDNDHLPLAEKDILQQLGNEWQQQKLAEQKRLLQDLFHLHAA